MDDDDGDLEDNVDDDDVINGKGHPVWFPSAGSFPFCFCSFSPPVDGTKQKIQDSPFLLHFSCCPCVCHISNAPTNGEKEDLLIAPWPQNKARLFNAHPTTSPLDMKLVI